MATIKISHEHAQPERIVRAALDELLLQLREEYQISGVWSGSRIDFHRAGANGVLTVYPHRVDIEIKLNMMLSMFERKIRAAIIRFCEEKLPG